MVQWWVLGPGMGGYQWDAPSIHHGAPSILHGDVVGSLWP